MDAPAIITRRAELPQFDLREALKTVRREGEVSAPAGVLHAEEGRVPDARWRRYRAHQGGHRFPVAVPDRGERARDALQADADRLPPDDLHDAERVSGPPGERRIDRGRWGPRLRYRLPEASLHADIVPNVLRITGAIQPIDWHEIHTPGALSWSMEELAMAARADADKKLVRGTGDFQGFGDITFATALKTAVADQGSVLTGLADAAAQVAEAYGVWPDAVLLSPTALARAQTEATANSRYLAKAGPEAIPTRSGTWPRSCRTTR